MNGRLSKKTRKAARKLALWSWQAEEVKAAKWRSLPWWRRAWLRIKWALTGELKGGRA